VLINVAIPGNLLTAVSGAAGLPAFSIGTDDMNALEALLEKARAKAHVKLDIEMRPGLRDASVWGTLPGVSDESIIVMAHHDAFYTGALDNASGMAVMLGLAEYYSKIPRAERPRTLKFVTTSGHHAGSAGTKWMHDNRETFLDKTALLINGSMCRRWRCDSTASAPACGARTTSRLDAGG
jgi:Zn-dependent M28 family amino/carboxypeptidase